MTTKFSIGKRSIFPPPVCKKVPPYPPMPDIPPNAIIVQIIGKYEDDVGRHWTHADKFTVFEDDPELWQPRVYWPMPGFYGGELFVSEDSKLWSFAIVREFTAGEDQLLETGFQPSSPGIPFHVLPFSILDPGWTGQLTVELTSA